MAANTNQRVFQEATRLAFPKAGDNRRIKPFSETYNDRKANLLGHVLRASHEDPMRQVSFRLDQHIDQNTVGRE